MFMWVFRVVVGFWKIMERMCFRCLCIVGVKECMVFLLKMI